MKITILMCLAILWGLSAAQSVVAQNLVVRNARVLDGNGGVINRGTIVVRRGRISSVSENPVVDVDLPIFDAQGMTVMPGFIDAHRQVIQGDPDEWMEQAAERMREYLEAGFTTVLSAGDPIGYALELRDRLDFREITGPRLLVSAHVPLISDSGDAVSQEEIRETIRDLALMGADAVALTVRATPGGREKETLSAARDEADQQGLLTITHIETIEDAVTAVEGGSGYLTRTPHVGAFDEEMARNIVETGRANAEYGLVMTSTLGIFLPAFADRNAYVRAGVGDDDNVPRFTDLEPFPINRLSSASQGLVNARILWNAGIIYGFGTGTPFPPSDALPHELIPLKLVFSNNDIVTILTKNAAFSVRRDDALGTLEPGKFADMVILGGDPLADIDNLLNVEVVIRTGQIVVDNR